MHKTSLKTRSRIVSWLRTSFLAGLIVIAPIGLTVWLLWSAVGAIDDLILPMIPETLLPQSNVGRNLHGIGLILSLVVVTIVGWVAKGFVGRTLIAFWEDILRRLPVVRSIYSGAKQIAETVLTESEGNFRATCLVEYPRKGVWAVGFLASPAKAELASHSEIGDDLMTVFVPTTPNPTSGFLLYVPRSAVVELDMPLEAGAKLIISAGLVYPDQKQEQDPKPDRT